MSIIILLVVLYVIYLDVNILRSLSIDVFKQSFKGFYRIWVPFLICIFLSLVLSEGGRENAFSYYLLFVLVFYLFKRSRWKDKLNSDFPTAQRITYPLSLKLDAFWLILVWAVSLVGLSFLYEAYKTISGTPTSEIEEILVSAIASSAILYILIYYVARRFSPGGFWFNIGMDRGSQSVWHVWIYPCLSGLFFAGLSAMILFSREVQPRTPLSAILQETQSSSAIAIFLFLAIIMAPFIEELTFRGYFFHVIKELKGRRYALICIALTFGALHMHQYWGDWVAIGMIFLLGFILTAFRAYTGGVKAGMVMHYVYNGAVIIIPMIILLTSHSAYFKYQTLYNHLSFTEKRTLLEESIEQNPEFSDAYNDLAWLYATDGSLSEEALDLVNTALEYDSENTAYLDTKAEVLQRLDFLEEALSVRETILELEKDSKLLMDQEHKINELKLLIQN